MSFLGQESLHILFFFLVFFGVYALQRSLSVYIGSGEISQDCSSSKYASIDGLGFLMSYTFTMAVMTSARRSLQHIEQRPPAAASPPSACDVCLF